MNIQRIPAAWIADLDDFASGRETIEVSDTEAIDTGLLDASGRKIVRHKPPIGFRLK